MKDNNKVTTTNVFELVCDAKYRLSSDISIMPKVVNTEDNWNTGIFSITLDSDVTVGGMLARVEDISMEKVSITHK